MHVKTICQLSQLTSVPYPTIDGMLEDERNARTNKDSHQDQGSTKSSIIQFGSATSVVRSVGDAPGVLSRSTWLATPVGRRAPRRARRSESSTYHFITGDGSANSIDNARPSEVLFGAILIIKAVVVEASPQHCMSYRIRSREKIQHILPLAARPPHREVAPALLPSSMSPRRCSQPVSVSRRPRGSRLHDWPRRAAFS